MVAMVIPLSPRSEGSVSIVVRGGSGAALPMGEWTAHQKVSLLTHTEVDHKQERIRTVEAHSPGKIIELY